MTTLNTYKWAAWGCETAFPVILRGIPRCERTRVDVWRCHAAVSAAGVRARQLFRDGISSSAPEPAEGRQAAAAACSPGWAGGGRGGWGGLGGEHQHQHQSSRAADDAHLWRPLLSLHRRWGNRGRGGMEQQQISVLHRQGLLRWLCCVWQVRGGVRDPREDPGASAGWHDAGWWPKNNAGEGVRSGSLL